jgi:hypothetical protein
MQNEIHSLVGTAYKIETQSKINQNENGFHYTELKIEINIIIIRWTWTKIQEVADDFFFYVVVF